jgi:hypothetical protein
MTHNRSQPRQPRGVPAGGQWRATDRPEGLLALSNGEPGPDEWASFGFGTDEWGAWADALFLPEEAAEWRREKFSPEQADEWRHNLFSASEATEWRGSFDDPQHAAAWQEGGFTPLEASRWRALGATLLGTHYRSMSGAIGQEALLSIGGEEVLVERNDDFTRVTDLKRRLHSVAGMPAVSTRDGFSAWAEHGLPHRDDGPARTWADGRREYWEQGLRLASYRPPGWRPGPPSGGWASTGGRWRHKDCPCSIGPAPMAEETDDRLVVCPACGDIAVAHRHW